MAPWTERLRAKLGRKKPLTAPLGEASSTSTVPHASAALDPAASQPSLPERLWNQAYDQAKAGDLSIVDTYERILSAQLSQKNADPADLASQQNEIDQNPEKRWVQMRRLVQDGLHRTEKETNVKQGMEDGIQAAMAVKEVVDKAIKAAPEAALAWVGVCLALEILMNPLTQASSNRQGIAYVVSRMDWYWNLSSLLLDENITEGRPQGLRGELEKNITHLYAKLLLYQMKSVCYYHRRRLSVLARDLIKLDDWGGELNDIQATEAAVQRDSEQYNTLSIRSRLGSIAETAKSQNTKLDSISSAIREQSRQQERMHETSADNKCLADLCSTDPRDDKTRIESTKGGLLQDSYLWILENPGFQQWRNDPQSRLLWIKADPGKGKTMLLCGIINELRKSMAKTGLLSYFFCQATDSRINNATAVLRGLVYLLVDQQPSLISYIRKKYDHAGKSLFEDANAWVALSEIFINLLQDPSLNSTYLVVDALDECMADLPKLLDFIVQSSSMSSRVKWIVSSRNWPDIEEHLERAGHKVRLSLELNAESVSTAVSTFIRHKVLRLAEQKKYDDKTRDAVLAHLSANANDTFLWVALVCQNLEKISRWNILTKLNTFPPGLDSLYKQMMKKIRNSDDADLCKRILASIAIIYRPITLKELTSLVEMPEDMADDLESLRGIIGYCGSFLTLREDTVYFVHQSAKDFLFAEASEDVFPCGRAEAHYIVFSRSLQALSKMLDRDMYNLRALGYPAERIKQPDQDPLAVSRYSCIYWVDHLYNSDSKSSANHEVGLQDGGAVHQFLRKKYLYWLEALSLCKSMSKGVVSMAKLETLIQGRADASALTELVLDARRFIMYHKWAIEQSPLQAYASALVFTPARSLMRGLFKEEEPKQIMIKPDVRDQWSACLQTLEGHSSSVWSVAFSHDLTRLASGSQDNTVKIWDASSGECLQTLEGHSGSVNSVAFSHDSTRLASGSQDSTVKIWDASSGECLQTLEGHSGSVNSVAFSHDSTRLASGSQDSTVKIWDASSGEYLQTLEGHGSWVCSVAFSHDSTRLASGSEDSTVKIWDASSGECLQTLEGHSGWVCSVAFSHDSTRLASGSQDSTVKIWDASSGEYLQTLEGHSGSVNSVAFSHDSTRLASGSQDSTVKIWDASSGECLQTLKGHSGWVCSVAFSYDSTRLASGAEDSTVKIWDASSGECLQTLKGHSGWVCSVAFSHDSTRLASGSVDNTVKIWDASSGEYLQTLEGHSGSVNSVAFSHDSTRLASGSEDSTVKIWDASSDECLQTFKVDKALMDISFDITDSYLHTEIGTIVIDASSVSNITPTVTEPQNPQYHGYALSSNKAWITYRSKNLLWLPSEYRPFCSTVSGETIAFGTRSGKVWICSFELENLKDFVA
ncbi:hypothetical protein EPUS_06803 [Endocarpon pusillum Z07020]|uniref:NACHT domain-containing protein n=1 Tax=Endocarpon pusillum (strain Z07020 / HMAS-L-300199) TaxID=1263415 RepID=U1FUC0_ENDPU|nr:uncharacterized protein EPUS_06803 [Endocarpon pusillum Z07020]ERF68387.1 hypothetical protein EPUS_06803 [Endocarpon pusillum Z07020]